MNIRFHGAIYNSSGYAQIRHLFLQLSNMGHSVKIVPYSSRDGIKILYENQFRQLEKTILEKPYINISCGIAPQILVDPEASYNIAYSMFETTEIPQRWSDSYNQFDEVWIPSKFCERSFGRKDLRTCLTVIPLGVNEEQFEEPKNSTNKEIFTFLSIGQWIDRKGWDVLIKAYIEEFMGQFDVRLCIKTYNDKKTNEEMIREYLSSNINNSTYMPRIMIKNQKVDEELMPLFYKEADCFILPSRGEAFNLPSLEAMASGVPPIISNFGGQTDFINEENGWLIPINNLKHLSERLCKINAAFTNLWFAEPEIHEVRKLMRFVYENRNILKEKGKIAREQVLKNWTWKNAARKAEKRLNDIWEKL